MSTTHELKTWPDPFQAILDGRKRHEIRTDDRPTRFAVLDVLHLREVKLTRLDEHVRVGDFTGREAFVRVTYLTTGGTWGLPGNLCVMSIELVDCTEPTNG